MLEKVKLGEVVAFDVSMYPFDDSPHNQFTKMLGPNLGSGFQKSQLDKEKANISIKKPEPKLDVASRQQKPLEITNPSKGDQKASQLILNLESKTT